MPPGATQPDDTQPDDTQRATPGSAPENPAVAEQLELVRGRAARQTRVTRRRDRELPPVASTAPIARVVIDVALPHLDREFDYLIPAALDEAAVPGARVRVRFAGKLTDGFLVARAEVSQHTGALARLHRVVSAESVLDPDVLALARAVASRYAGTLSDVLRLAVPPRHARVEGETPRAIAAAPQTRPSGAWEAYPDGAGFLAALAANRAPRAVWAAVPGTDWAAALAEAMRVTVASGAGALAVVPDVSDLAVLEAALQQAFDGSPFVSLRADLGPAERYRRWLAVRRGAVRAVVGTRAAMFAPVADLGLVAIWDDGDDLHAEPRAPYPHAREVLCMRAHAAGAAALLGGHAVTAEGAALVASGWARPLRAERDCLRRLAPRVQPAGSDAELAQDAGARSARLPSLAWQTVRSALQDGPVLLQVPRRGYLPAVACARCRLPARCPACGGILELTTAGAVPRCRWCAQLAGSWCCPDCAATTLRSLVVGARRTAEELGRAFPGVAVHSSHADAGVLTTVDDAPALVVATPGAEPRAARGYAAAVLLDGAVLLNRPQLRAGEQALRRWANAAALVRPGRAVIVLAEPTAAGVQALLRWDMHGYADRELTDRQESGFPPAVRLAAITGPTSAVAEVIALAELPVGTEVLGPVPLAADTGGEPADAPDARAILRVPRARGLQLSTALRAAVGVRSARKGAGVARIRIDPVDLG